MDYGTVVTRGRRARTDTHREAAPVARTCDPCQRRKHVVLRFSECDMLNVHAHYLQSQGATNAQSH